MMRIFGASTDETFKAYGKYDPYFAVLSHEEFRRENLSPRTLERFFQSGETAISDLLSRLAAIGINLQSGRALDFGCGVGRLTIPVARRFREVVAVDISEDMLRECKKNIANQDLNNVTLSSQMPDQKFDLVHSALVLQHINASRGTEIILEAWSKLTVGGLLAIQLPIQFSGRRLVWWMRQIRDAFPILQLPYNILRGHRFNKPGVQMNIYDLNSLSARLLQKGAGRIILLPQISDNSFFGVYLLAENTETVARPH